MAQVPTRELILDALATKVGARRADREINLADLPASVLWDGEDTNIATDTVYGEVAVTTSAGLIAQHVAAADYATWSTQGQEILAQAIADATGGDNTLGGLCDGITYTATAVMYPDEGSAIITIGLDLAITWRHPIGNPYTTVPD